MPDVVFKPKYKAMFWFFFVLLLILALSVLGVGIMMMFIAFQRKLYIEETIMMVGFLVMFGLIVFCSLNLVIRKIVIGNSGISAATLLGTVRRRPFIPNVYYEQGCFIINGFVIANIFFKNISELDGTFKKLSSEGKLKYKREKGVLDSRPAGYSMIMLISACILGIFFSISLWMLQPWTFVIVIDGLFLIWLIITFNKLPRANKSILKQLDTYFE